MLEVLAKSPVRKIYLIQSRGTVLSAKRKDGRPYLIGFLNQAQPDYLKSSICPESKVEFVDYSPESFSIVRVEKKINLDMAYPCETTQMPFYDFMSLPSRQKLSVMFSFQIIDEDPKSFVLETQTYDAVDNVSTFREALNNRS
jgi:hypothetical protein